MKDDIEEVNLTLRKHTYREDMTAKKKLGIIEKLKAAKTEKEVAELTNKLTTYDQASDKTVRKFSKIQRRKRAQLRKKKK